MASRQWGTDTAISMPVPPTQHVLVILGGGFCFTAGGIGHDLTQADMEEMLVPTFAPPNIDLREDGGQG